MQGNCEHLKKRTSIDGAIAASGVAVLLIGGAWATAVAVSSPTHFWLAWVSLLPLFAAIRLFSVKLSISLGGLWGGCLYLFLAVSPDPMPAPIASIPATLITIPAVYAALMTAFSRRFGYSTLAMALGWILVELAFNLAGLRHGLLSVGSGQGPALQIIADFLGSGFVAFVVIYVNAFLISMPIMLCLAGFSLPENNYLQNSLFSIVQHTECFLSKFNRDLSRPRAPPALFDTDQIL